MCSRGDPKRTILLVDDDALVRQTVHMVLTIDGYDVVEAEDGPQALDAFVPGRFALVLTDWFMPRMSGIELAAAIKTRCPNQTVVMITAFAEKAQAQGNRGSGVDLLIGKPFEIEVLRAAVAKCSTVPKLDSPETELSIV